MEKSFTIKWKLKPQVKKLASIFKITSTPYNFAIFGFLKYSEKYPHYLVSNLNPSNIMSKNSFETRRTFLSRCATIAAVTSLPEWFVQEKLTAAMESTNTLVTSPNSRPGIALIGCGGMGNVDAGLALKWGDIVAVCDVDQRRVDKAVIKYTKDGKAPTGYSDFRKIMERKDVDVIVNGTPDHWHTLINIAAAKAKKDIYTEKPLTLTIDEGKRLIKVVRDHKVVLQTGTQQRSIQRFHLACELVRNGRIGKLKEVKVYVPAGISGGPFESSPVPPELDWDFWQGQTPQVDYVKQRCHGSYRWWWEYAAGPVTDWGAHHNDIARWGIGLTGPVEIEAKALKAPVPGGYNTPSEFEATLVWPNGIIQTVNSTTDDNPGGSIINPEGQRNGIKFIGTDGWIWVNRSEIKASNMELLRSPLPANAFRLEVSLNHMKNFFDCLVSRKDPISCVEEGHRSASIGHLIVIALRSGGKFQWDPENEIFVGEGAAKGNAQIAREMRKPYDYSFVG